MSFYYTIIPIYYRVYIFVSRRRSYRYILFDKRNQYTGNDDSLYYIINTHTYIYIICTSSFILSYISVIRCNKMGS